MRITEIEGGWFRAEQDEPRMSVEGASREIVSSIVERFTLWYLEKKSATKVEPPIESLVIDASGALEEKRIDDIYKSIYVDKEQALF